MNTTKYVRGADFGFRPKTKKEQRAAALKAYETELERINNEPDEDIIEVDGKRYQLIK